MIRFEQDDSRRRAVLIPFSEETTPGLVEAIEQAGFRVIVAHDIQQVTEHPDVLIINVCGFGEVSDWTSRLRTTLEAKMTGHLANVPTLVIDPPPNKQWNVIGGRAGEVDAYFQWPGQKENLMYLLDRLPVR
jgi:hypothetical protein